MTKDHLRDAAQALPELPEPWSAASAVICAACKKSYVPPAMGTVAANALFQPVKQSACACGSTSFTATIGYDSPSPAKFTADQMREYGRACLASPTANEEPAEPFRTGAETRELFVNALRASKGWTTAYAESVVDDAFARTAFNLLPASEAVPAVPAGEPEPNDALILRIALTHAYDLLSVVVEQNGTLGKHLINEIKKVLPERYPAGFAGAAARRASSPVIGGGDSAV